MPIDYSKGKIYKIIDLDSNECYIGSTCEPTLARRLAGHVGNYKSYLKGIGNYITSFKIIQNDNYDIVLIENYPCNSKDELHARESHFTQTVPCVNKVKNQGLIKILGLVEYKKQHYEANKDQIIDYKKQYYEDNKEHIQKQRNQKINCQCGGCYTTSSKARHYKTTKHLQWLNNTKLNKH